MKREQAAGPCLSAVFVDYDNIYLSLKRKNEEAAKRFAKDAQVWLKEIENGRLITPTNGPSDTFTRRIVMNRCYGNPVPRRNQNDNSTDMNSFPFVRHHFLRAGFEITDCPPLTAQLKNSSDIRMVMDVRDFLTHETYFDEFVILSGDADFTPVLHRLRAHARRTVIFANDYTAAPYTAISDGEVREADLIRFLIEGKVPGEVSTKPTESAEELALRSSQARTDIMVEILTAVRATSHPVPIEALADRAVRALGNERTIGTSWAGAGTFRSFLLENLPDDIRLSEQPPYVAIDLNRHQQAAASGSQPIVQPGYAPQRQQSALPPAGYAPQRTAPPQAQTPVPQQPTAPPRVLAGPAPLAMAALPGAALQQSIARIHDACQAPPLEPNQYRALFEVMAQELNENGLSGAQTVTNITQRANDQGLEVRREDVRFVLEVVSEADPWFEQGASANLFAGRFRNFVVARCRGQALNLSADELDLIDMWFAGGAVAPQAAARVQAQALNQAAQAMATPPTQAAPGERYWPQQAGPPAPHGAAADPTLPGPQSGADEFPRIIRSRGRG